MPGDERGLLPCPFCGEEPKTVSGRDSLSIFCCNAMCAVQPETGAIRDEKAIAAWNTRASGWRDIASAPRDGTTVLLWGLYQQEPCTALFRGGQWIPVWDGFSVIEYMSDFGTDYKTIDVPTHWMPLPIPPTNGANNEE